MAIVNNTSSHINLTYGGGGTTAQYANIVLGGANIVPFSDNGTRNMLVTEAVVSAALVSMDPKVIKVIDEQLTAQLQGVEQTYIVRKTKEVQLNLEVITEQSDLINRLQSKLHAIKYRLAQIVDNKEIDDEELLEELRNIALK